MYIPLTRLFVAGLALAAAVNAGAQANRISIGLNALGMRNLRENMPDRNMTGSQKAVLFLPSVGYYRLIGKTTGIGIELGYNGATQRESSVRTNGNNVHSSGSEATYQEFYACPALLETFRSKNGKYVFIGSVSLPVNYSPSGTSSSYQRSMYVQQEYSTTYTAPTSSMLKIGLFMNGGIQRKLLGGLFLGLQAGLGGTHSQGTAKGMLVTDIVNGSQTFRTETELDNSGREFKVEIRPMASLNYYF